VKSETLKRYRSGKIVRRLATAIENLMPDRKIKIVHVCGSHERTIVMFGLRELLPNGLEVFSGPGCPVCCTPAEEIDMAIELARSGVTVTTFGDMLRVPGSDASLAKAREEGKDVRVVYSISDAVELAKREPEKEVVHMAIGFETTAPSTASTALSNPPKNFSVLISHLLIPPVMEYLLRSGESQIDGFICPGHVSTIIGSAPYEPISESYNVPQVIAGFEPVDVMLGILMLLKQMKEGRHEVEIEYTRSVKRNGNPVALELMERAFVRVGKAWRGFPEIPYSALALRDEFEGVDARKKFRIKADRASQPPEGCRCGEVLRGLIYPWECPLFGRACTPEHPVGPCAVSSEGACNVAMKYGRRPSLRTARL